MNQMDSITYKCPNCDGGLVFEPESQKFKCGYCLSEFTEAELKALTPASGEAQAAVPDVNAETAKPDGNTGTPEMAETAEMAGTAAETAKPDQARSASKEAEPVIMEYHCPSCGAQLAADETTAATFCYYCHNPVVLAGKLAGNYRPDYVIPFEMDRKKAEEIFKGWIRRKKYVPRDFYSPKQMELMEGVYYPYWLYDCQIDGRITAEASKANVSRLGAVEYTETSRFQVERQGTMEVKNVTRNALKKADHRLAEGVLPFDMEKLHPFEAGYLSGFKAERRDLEKDAYEQEVDEEIQNFAVNQLRGSITGYDSVAVRDHQEKVLSSEWKYALMPVWVLTYKDKKDDKLYYFAMNGQSGKICGVLPVDYKRLAGLFAAIFFPLFLLFLIGGYLI